jgi:hypothetical protein
MGGDESSSAETTEVVTNTTTTVRDIGLTGRDAVELAKVIGTTQISSQQMAAGLLADGHKANADALTRITSLADPQDTPELVGMLPWIAAGAAAVAYFANR